MARTTRSEWVVRVAQWKASALSTKEFAAQLGVPPATLAWWKWRLGSSKPRAPSAPKRVPSTRADAKRARGASPSSSRALSRRPVSVAAKAATISPLAFVELTVPLEPEPLEVVLPTRVRVRVPRGFDDATLARLLDVLEGRR